jgi:exonuclease SbcD
MHISRQSSLTSCPVRVVWRTDVHVADVTPISRTDNWVETVLDKLRQVGQIATEVQAQAVLDGGDFFHVKSPSRTSHRLLRQVVEVHQEYPCPVYANFGNHDSVYGDLRWLEQQPLGVLFETGTFQKLFDEYELLLDVAGVTVRVVGIPYHGVSYDRGRLQVKKGSEDYLVVIAHLLASNTNQESFYEGEDVMRYQDLRDLDADVFAFGHLHKDQGIQEIAPGKWVVNIGSLTRGTLSQDSDRIPSCAVLGFGKAGVYLEQRALRVASAAEVFDIQGRARIDSRAAVLDGFIEKMQHTALTTSSKSLAEQIRDLPNVPDAVRERALLILEQS